MKKSAVRSAFLDTVPVMTGYVFLGFGFGILMQQSGFRVLWAFAMSLVIYAGSMQYVAVSLLTSGAGLVTAALTAFVVNARHLFYGISMVDAYKGAGRKKPYLIFALTDETYSLVTQNQPPEGMKRHTKICHGDFHPSNVIITPEGKPYILDWSHATQGNASADVARTYLLFWLSGDIEGAQKYLELFCKKSDTARQYVQKWMPIVAASQSVKGNASEREFLLSWVSVVDYQ